MSKSGDVCQVISSIRSKGYDIEYHSCEEGDFNDYDVVALLEEIECLMPVDEIALSKRREKLRRTTVAS